MAQHEGRFEFQRDKRGEEFVRRDILNPKVQFLKMLEVQNPPQESVIPEADYSAASLREILKNREYRI